jgi:hypothetical protein
VLCHSSLVFKIPLKRYGVLLTIIEFLVGLCFVEKTSVDDIFPFLSNRFLLWYTKMLSLRTSRKFVNLNIINVWVIRFNKISFVPLKSLFMSSVVTINYFFPFCLVEFQTLGRRSVCVLMISKSFESMPTGFHFDCYFPGCTDFANIAFF